MSNGNLEARIAALEAQMQEMRNLLQQAIVTVNEASAIAKSNARSIQAWEALIEQNKVEAEEERSEMKVLIRELIRANQQNTIDHELFRRRFETIDPPTDAPQQ